MKQFIDKLSIEKIKNLKGRPKEIRDWNFYWKLGLSTVRNLETPDGILASGKNEIYGAIFGRDSLITSLKLIKVYQETKEDYLLGIVRKVLLTLSNLQGKEVNIESGEEPGKCIHEYRTDNHDHLTKSQNNPWYVYPDGTLRSYDTVDATALFLITIYRYYQASKDEEFIEKLKPNIEQALRWIFTYGDSNGDGFLDFQLKPERKFGGLVNQNWMDSSESTFHEDEDQVAYPLAPVEAQAYAYLALRLWSKYSFKHDSLLADKLFASAYQLKENFNNKFIIQEKGEVSLASALDNNGKALKSVRSSMGHCLWASLNLAEDNELDGILSPEYIEPIVKRLFQPDLFEEKAGIRTLSKLSRSYDPRGYHNGSIWPHDNSMIAEGLENYGYTYEAGLIKKALLTAYAHFQTPVELFVFDHTFHDYLSPSGQSSCKQQAWSAAAILKTVARDYSSHKKRKLAYLPKAELLSKQYFSLNKLTSKAIKWLFIVNN